MAEINDLYQSIQSKLKERKNISINALVLSEFNTRAGAMDQDHVDYLANKIKERGFHPERAISINVITNVAKEDHAYRVVAGVHRYYAAKNAGLNQIPCILYYGLTDEEECLLDKWNNEMDEDHKPVNFIQESEHLNYLQDEKEWGTKKIAKYKNISRRLVEFKLKIAKLPESVKEIIKKGNQIGNFFQERYFRDICKLKTLKFLILICTEIFNCGMKFKAKEKMADGSIIQPMKKEDIKIRVEELLEQEKNNFISSDYYENTKEEMAGRTEKKYHELIDLDKNDNKSEFHDNIENKSVQCDPGRTVHSSVENNTFSATFDTNDSEDDEEENCDFSENPDRDENDLDEEHYENLYNKIEKTMKKEEKKEVKKEENKIINNIQYRTFNRWTTHSLYFNTIPRWILHSAKIKKSMTKSEWATFTVLIMFNTRFHSRKGADTGDYSFFVGGIDTNLKKTCSLVAEEGYLSSNTVRKCINSLIKMGYIQIIRNGNLPTPRFLVDWDKLAEIYSEEMENISFEFAGVKDIPKHFTGYLQATPLHAVLIQDGVVSPLLSSQNLYLLDEMVKIRISLKNGIILLKRYGDQKISSKIREFEDYVIICARKGKSIKNSAGLFIDSLEKDYSLTL